MSGDQTQGCRASIVLIACLAECRLKGIYLQSTRRGGEAMVSWESSNFHAEMQTNGRGCCQENEVFRNTLIKSNLNLCWKK